MQDGIYKVTKGALEFTEIIRNDRTSDGWFASELIGIGYKLEKISDLSVPEEEIALEEGEG